MAMDEVLGPQIKRKSGTGAPVQKIHTVTPPALRKTGKGAPTPPVPKNLRKFGGPK